jgi:hypothetical protein
MSKEKDEKNKTITTDSFPSAGEIAGGKKPKGKKSKGKSSK